MGSWIERRREIGGWCAGPQISCLAGIVRIDCHDVRYVEQGELVGGEHQGVDGRSTLQRRSWNGRASGALQLSAGHHRQCIHHLRAAGQRHLQLSPAGQIEVQPRFRLYATLHGDVARRTAAQRLIFRGRDALKVFHPSQIEPRLRRRVQVELLW